MKRCDCYGCWFSGTQGFCGCLDCKDCGEHFEEPLTADEDGYRCDACIDGVIAAHIGAEVLS